MKVKYIQCVKFKQQSPTGREQFHRVCVLEELITQTTVQYSMQYHEPTGTCVLYDCFVLVNIQTRAGVHFCAQVGRNPDHIVSALQNLMQFRCTGNHTAIAFECMQVQTGKPCLQRILHNTELRLLNRHVWCHHELHFVSPSKGRDDRVLTLQYKNDSCEITQWLFETFGRERICVIEEEPFLQGEKSSGQIGRRKGSYVRTDMLETSRPRFLLSLIHQPFALFTLVKVLHLHPMYHKATQSWKVSKQRQLEERTVRQFHRILADPGAPYCPKKGHSCLYTHEWSNVREPCAQRKSQQVSRCSLNKR